jgi:hypothetical protein
MVTTIAAFEHCAQLADGTMQPQPPIGGARSVPGTTTEKER